MHQCTLGTHFPCCRFPSFVLLPNTSHPLRDVIVTRHSMLFTSPVSGVILTADLLYLGWSVEDKNFKFAISDSKEGCFKTQDLCTRKNLTFLENAFNVHKSRLPYHILLTQWNRTSRRRLHIDARNKQEPK